MSESIDTEAIPGECERPDCQQIAATASDVYCQITGGRLSYPTYDARTIMAEADDYTNRLIDEATAELRSERDSLRAEVESARTRRDQAYDQRDAAEAKLAAASEHHTRVRYGMSVCCKQCSLIPADHFVTWPCATAVALGVADNRSNEVDDNA